MDLGRNANTWLTYITWNNASITSSETFLIPPQPLWILPEHQNICNEQHTEKGKKSLTFSMCSFSFWISSVTFCRRVLRLGKSRSWIAASWNTPTPRWWLSNRAILVQQQGYTGSATGLYWFRQSAVGWTLPSITQANHIDQVQRNARQEFFLFLVFQCEWSHNQWMPFF